MNDRKATLIQLALGALAFLALMALLSMMGCRTFQPAKPCDPIRVPYPVIQPCPAPPALDPLPDRLEALPAEAWLSDEEIAARAGADPGVVRRIREAILYALLLDLRDCRDAVAMRDRILEVYRNGAAVPPVP